MRLSCFQWPLVRNTTISACRSIDFNINAECYCVIVLFQLLLFLLLEASTIHAYIFRFTIRKVDFLVISQILEQHFPLGFWLMKYAILQAQYKFLYRSSFLFIFWPYFVISSLFRCMAPPNFLYIHSRRNATFSCKFYGVFLSSRVPTIVCNPNAFVLNKSGIWIVKKLIEILTWQNIICKFIVSFNRYNYKDDVLT